MRLAEPVAQLVQDQQAAYGVFVGQQGGQYELDGGQLVLGGVGLLVVGHVLGDASLGWPARPSGGRSQVPARRGGGSPGVVSRGRSRLGGVIWNSSSPPWPPSR